MRAGITLLLGSTLGSSCSESSPANEPGAARKPIRVLLVTGEPFPNDRDQAKILIEGLATRANVEWTVVNEEENETNDKLTLFEKPSWAEGFDVVHNECHAEVDDPAYVAKVVAVHEAGVPALVVHRAMHMIRRLKSDQWDGRRGRRGTSPRSLFRLPRRPGGSRPRKTPGGGGNPSSLDRRPSNRLDQRRKPSSIELPFPDG